MLDEEGLLLDTLAPVAVLTRFKYGASFKELENIYSLSHQTYTTVLTEATSSGGIGNMAAARTNEFLAAQARLCLLNYLIGSIIGSQVSRISAAMIENFDEINANLASLVFSLINSSNQNATVSSGMLKFFFLFIVYFFLVRSYWYWERYYLQVGVELLIFCSVLPKSLHRVKST